MSSLSSHSRAVLAVLALLPALVLADPPARVGRLALIENGVDFRAERDDAATPAAPNWPISSGAVLETDRRGRAEIWVGSTAYRLGSNSRAEFAIVDDRQVTLQVDEGSLAVSILDGDQADDVTVHTPDGSIRFAAPGRYRIDVLADHSELRTQAGQAQLDDRGRLTPVSAGQKVSFQSGGRMWIEGDSALDGFDRWVAERENATLARASRRYVSPYMTGYQDLDAYGDWRPAEEYGSVWYPRAVADDWAPYRFGRWAWVEPWGWTWIDQAPWGFAPFHYGRWVLIQGRWAWTPGRLALRPVYAPALVGWLGNPGWSLSFGFGSAPAVGWFPLAPREVFVPSYRHSNAYVRQINVTHVQDVAIIDRAVRSGANENFAHRALSRAVTVVPASMLREGRSITPTEVRRAGRPDLGRAPLAGRAPSSEWVAPPASALRSRPEGRNEQASFQGRRGDEPRSRLPVESGAAPRVQSVSPSLSPRESGRESPRQERQGVRDGAPPAFRQDAPPTEREAWQGQRDGQRFERRAPGNDSAPSFRPPETSQPTQSRERDFRREMRDEPRPATRVSEAPVLRQPETPPPAIRAPIPQAAPQPAPPPREREFRREMRDEPRPAPRPSEAPAIRQPEAQPAIRGPIQQVAPQPAPPPREREFRREMREEPRPAPRPSEAPVVRSPPPPPPQAVPQPQPQAAPAQQESRGRERGRDGARDRDRDERERGH